MSSVIAGATQSVGPLRALARLLLGSLVAAAITLGLYLLMAELIAAGREAMTEGPDGRIVDFVRIGQEPELKTQTRKPEKPEKPEAPPPDAPAPETETQAPTAGAVNIGRLDVDASLTSEGFRLSASDGEYLPIVKVAPIYPARAQSQGIEGYVLLEFTVSETGAVKDPRVVESEPGSVFDDAALAAVKKFKYKPRVRNGEPISVPGVQHLITFEIDE